MARIGVRRAVILASLEKYVCFGITTATSLVVARLLTPTEIGVYSVAAVFVALAGTIRDLSAGTYLVQETALDSLRIRAAFTLALTMGVALAVLVASASGVAAAFYGEPLIGQVLLVLAINFVLVPLGSVTQALLWRELRADALAVIRTAAVVVNSVAVVLLAWLQFGVMSLAWAAVAASVTSACVSMLYRPRDLSFRPSLVELPRVLRSGTWLTGGSILDTLSRSSVDLVLGRLQGFAGLAYFSKAQSVVGMSESLAMAGVRAVILPYLSEKKRSEQSLLAPYQRLLVLLNSLTLPFLLGISIAPLLAVRVLFGDQWDRAAQLLPLVALSGALASLQPLSRDVLVAAGCLRAQLTLQAWTLSLRVAGAGIGAVFSLEAAVVGLLVAGVASFALQHRALQRAIDLRIGDYWLAIRAALLPVAASAVGPFALVFLDLPIPASEGARLAAMALLGVMGWALAIGVCRHPLRAEFVAGYGAISGLIRRHWPGWLKWT